MGRPNVGDVRQFFGRMEDVFARRWLTNHGAYVAEFENRVALFNEVKHAVAVTNATAGLQIALRAAGVTGSVVVPAFTFVATVHALSWIGLRPIFCDVAPGTFHLDAGKVESVLEPDTTAILGVHVWGEPCDIASLARLADRHNLKLLFDAAHAFGCSYRGRMVGNFGLAEVFSFHATKFINCFEGGAICTNDDRLAQIARQMRDFGFDDSDNVVRIGTNAKMCEAAAAMGLTNLECIEDFIAINRENHRGYSRQLDGVPGIEVYQYDSREQRNYQYVAVRVDESASGLSRDDLMRVLRAENVLARRYFYPGAHRAAPYQGLASDAQLPRTSQLCREMLTLPTGTSVSAGDIAAICQLIRLAVSQGEPIRQRLRSAAIGAGAG